MPKTPSLADYTVEQAALLSHERGTEGSAGITMDTFIANMGYRYHTGALVREEGETLPLAQHPNQRTGQPGTHAPHLVLERQGEPISTPDLYGQRWVLLVGPEGQPQREAAQRVAQQFNLPLDIHQLGGELIDVNGHFCRAHGITASGAVLVRPASFIAWRSQTAGEQPEHALAQALTKLLHR